MEKNDKESKNFRRMGHPMFNKGKYHDAITFYNKSICFAKMDSTAMGIGYELRSQCFFKLNLFQKCMTDIELARQAKYPKQYMSTVDRREAACLRKSFDSALDFNVFSGQEPKLDLTESSKFVGVANCLQVQHSTADSHHVITTEKLTIGQTVMIEDAYSVTPVNVYNRCSSCFRENMNFVPCENCVTSLFCSNECQRTDQVHNYTCGVRGNFSRDSALVFEMVIKAILAFPRMALLKKTFDAVLNNNDPHVHDDLTNEQSKFVMILQLATNKYADEVQSNSSGTWISETDDVFDEIMRIPEFNSKFHSSNKKQQLLEDIIDVLFAAVNDRKIELIEWQSDGDRWADVTCDTYAHGMFPFGCLLKNSCVPNVFCYYDDNRMICKVIRPIEAGQQLCRSYFDGMKSLYFHPIDVILIEGEHAPDCPCFVCKRIRNRSLGKEPLYRGTIHLHEFKSMLAKSVQEYHGMLWSGELSRIERLAFQLLGRLSSIELNDFTDTIYRFLFTHWNLSAQSQRS